MEIKKSRNADLERQRPQRFLIGLLAALSALFVALEYNLTPSDPLDDLDDLSLSGLLAMDPELSPLLRPESELSLAPKAEPRPTRRIVVAADDAEAPTVEEEPVETDAGSDMEPQPDDDAGQEPPPPPGGDEAVSLRVVEEMPQFPGGPGEMMKWLTRNLHYPKLAEAQKQQGKVVAEFIVERDGSVTDVKIVKPLSPACDREVLRVLGMMPRWTAGVQDGQPCRTKVCIPVAFHL